MIVALAGRRIDPADADPPRFPLSNVELVRGRLNQLLVEKDVSALVCSAACGADLLALSSAGQFGIRRRVVLSFSREHFRKTSVVDRPGNWGSLFDAICEDVSGRGDLVVLDCSKDDEAAYSKTSRAILNEAIEIRNQRNDLLVAVIVWEGASRGDDDETAAFAEKARDLGLDVIEVLTK